MSNPCGKCGKRPAFWHSPTLSWLCAGHVSEYRRRFRAELEEAWAVRRHRTSPLALIVALAASAAVWVAVVRWAMP